MQRLDLAARQRLLQEDAAWIGKPLGLNPSRRVAEAHVRHLALILRDTGIAHRAIAASSYAGTLFDASLAEAKSGPVACGKGCHHCCHQLIMVTIPDVLRLAQALRGDAARIARIREGAAQARVLVASGNKRPRLACPVLQDNACSAYDARPVPCRFLLSQSLAACVRIFQDNIDEAFPYTDGTVIVRQRIDQIVQAALLLNRLRPYHHELTQSLEIALTEERVEERWLAGEPLFNHVPVNGAELNNPATGAAVEQLASLVAPTL
jgi:hypothetical protein